VFVFNDQQFHGAFLCTLFHYRKRMAQSL